MGNSSQTVQCGVIVSPFLLGCIFVYLKLFHLFSTCSGASSVLGITLVTENLKVKKPTVMLAFMEPTVWWKRQLLHGAQVASSHRVILALEKKRRAMRRSVGRINLSLWLRHNLIRM